MKQEQGRPLATLQNAIHQLSNPTESKCKGFKFSTLRQYEPNGFTAQSIAKRLTELYKIEVAKRGGNYIADNATEERIAWVSRFLTNEKVKGSLILYGGVGCGKTTLLNTIFAYFEWVKQTAQRISRNSFDATDITRYNAIASAVPLPEYTTATTYSKVAMSDADADKVVKMNKDYAKVLFLDDMGVEPIVVNNWGTKSMPITDLVYYKYDTSRSLFITTNADDEQIAERYGDRVADRLHEMAECLAFDNKTYRK